jgi:hypothetical protein
MGKLVFFELWRKDPTKYWPDFWVKSEKRTFAPLSAVNFIIFGLSIVK